jgi:hypothetical protein
MQRWRLRLWRRRGSISWPTRTKQRSGRKVYSPRPRAARQHVAGASDVTDLDAGALALIQFAPQVADVRIDAAVAGSWFGPEHAFRQKLPHLDFRMIAEVPGWNERSATRSRSIIRIKKNQRPDRGYFLPQDEPLQFYLTKIVGNSFYHAAELITHLVAINLMCPPSADPNDLAIAQGSFNSRP